MNKDGMTLANFKRFQKMLIVIDESHNLRNDGSNRYQFLIENFYQNLGNRDIKTLMLTATPINNKLTDIRNQFKLVVMTQDLEKPKVLKSNLYSKNLLMRKSISINGSLGMTVG